MDADADPDADADADTGLAALERSAGGGCGPAVAEAVGTLADGADVRAVVLVEGMSDKAAVEALAARRGGDLAAEHVLVVPTGGATSFARFLRAFGPRGFDVRVAGLCDAGEEVHLRRGLRQAGLGDGDLTRARMAALGFQVCDADLEDELIRALGVTAVEAVVDAAGERAAYRTFARQPAQRGRSDEQRLRRFLGTRSGRKIRYGRLLVEALDPARVPEPLERLLAHV